MQNRFVRKKASVLSRFFIRSLNSLKNSKAIRIILAIWTNGEERLSLLCNAQYDQWEKGNEQFGQDILKHSYIQVSLTADNLFFFNATVDGKFESHS